jgi:flagellar motor switch protein FliN/FliY
MSDGQDIAETGPAQSGSDFAGQNFDVLAAVPLRLSVEAGSTSLSLAELLALKEGSVIELNRQTGELLDVLVNGTVVARGEIVAVDGRFGIRIVEVAKSAQRGASLGLR